MQPVTQPLLLLSLVLPSFPSISLLLPPYIPPYRGVAYSVKAYQIPLGSRIAKGVPLPQVLPISSEEQVKRSITSSAFIFLRNLTVLFCIAVNTSALYNTRSTALDDTC
jgi:DNA gyrase/topoisomerase IV subunit A